MIVVFAGVDVFLPCGGVICGAPLCVEVGEGLVSGELLRVEAGEVAGGVPAKNYIVTTYLHYVHTLYAFARRECTREFFLLCD